MWQVDIIESERGWGQRLDETREFESHEQINFGFGFPSGSGPGSRVQGLGPRGNLTPWLGFQYGGNQAFPIFGGYSPNAGARLDFSKRGPNGGYSG